MYITNKMDIRDKIVEKFKELLNEEDSKTLEENIYNNIVEYCKKKYVPVSFKNQLFKNLYVDKSRQLYLNLNEESYVNNKQLMKMINKKKIKIEKLCDCHYKELLPSKWKKYVKDLEILNDKISDTKEMTTTDQFKCQRCKKNKCVYSQFQIRSADEGITSFITCLNCGYNWREN
jgi:transcription elongation factor S-II